MSIIVITALIVLAALVGLAALAALVAIVVGASTKRGQWAAAHPDHPHRDRRSKRD